MFHYNPYWQQWEPVLVVIQQPAPPNPWDTFWQEFASHLAVVVAGGIGAAALDQLLN